MFLGKVGQAIARRVDGVVVEKYIKGNPRSIPRDPQEIDAMIRHLHALSERYDEPELYTSPATFFPAPPTPSPTAHKSKHGVIDLWWRSGYAPFHPEVEGDYTRNTLNHTARARILPASRKSRASGQPRRAIIFIHGYRGGNLTAEKILWPVGVWQDAGYDVAMIVQPHHGPRKDPSSSRPLFPSADPRITIEGLRQAVWDTRSLAAWLHERGASSVGVCGMSLGGLVCSLLLGCAEEFSFAIPTIPLTSFAAWGDDHSTHPGEGTQRARYAESLARATRVVDPLSRPPVLPSARIAVVAGRADRINRLHHAKSIAAHAGAELILIPGGHVLQFGLGEAFENLARRFATESHDR